MVSFSRALPSKWAQVPAVLASAKSGFVILFLFSLLRLWREVVVGANFPYGLPPPPSRRHSAATEVLIQGRVAPKDTRGITKMSAHIAVNPAVGLDDNAALAKAVLIKKMPWPEDRRFITFRPGTLEGMTNADTFKRCYTDTDVS